MSERDTMADVSKMKDEILTQYERLGLEDEMIFSCNPSVPCFGKCCHDINIFLTPYDILRLKTRLGISSEEFIAKYALSPPVAATNQVPMIVLRMSDQEGKPCQFLSEQGCTVYEDRPWACRMYPLGIASQKTEANPDGEEFFYLIHEPERCKGHGLGEPMKIKDYLDGQKVQDYNEMNDMFKELTMAPFWQRDDRHLPPQQVQMFYMACYNLDMFKRFIFNSRFFEIMDVEEGLKERIEADEVELMKFGFQWLRYSLFGEGPLKVKEDAIEKKKVEWAAQMEAEQEKKQKAQHQNKKS